MHVHSFRKEMQCPRVNSSILSISPMHCIIKKHTKGMGWRSPIECPCRFTVLQYPDPDFSISKLHWITELDIIIKTICKNWIIFLEPLQMNFYPPISGRGHRIAAVSVCVCVCVCVSVCVSTLMAILFDLWLWECSQTDSHTGLTAPILWPRPLTQEVKKRLATCDNLTRCVKSVPTQ